MFFMIRIFLLMLLFAFPAHAQVQTPMKPEQLAYMAQLQSFNSTNPAMSPVYEKPGQFLRRNVLDSAKRIVGSSRDLIIDMSGGVQQIAVNIDRINGIGGNHIMYFDFASVTRQPESHALQLSVQSDEIAANLAQYLTPAAGEAGRDMFALTHMRDAQLRYSNGGLIAKVREGLLSDSGSKLEALVLDDIRGGGASRKIAIPYNPDIMKIGEVDGKLVFYLQAPYDKAFVKYAHDAR
jgi:hypothetical protein